VEVSIAPESAGGGQKGHSIVCVDAAREALGALDVAGQSNTG